MTQAPAAIFKIPTNPHHRPGQGQPRPQGSCPAAEGT